MEKTKKILMCEFYVTIFLALIVVILFENDLLITGGLTEDKNSEFILATVFELMTIFGIPLALRLFKFKRVHEKITSDESCMAGRLVFWGTVRMMMICIPLFANTLLYYLYMNVAFGYMAIILLLCMFFIYPSRQRFLDETK